MPYYTFHKLIEPSNIIALWLRKFYNFKEQKNFPNFILFQHLTLYGRFPDRFLHFSNFLISQHGFFGKSTVSQNYFKIIK